MRASLDGQAHWWIAVFEMRPQCTRRRTYPSLLQYVAGSVKNALVAELIRQINTHSELTGL